MRDKRTIENERRLKEFFLNHCPDIRDIVFNYPVIVVILRDGRKGVVRPLNGDRYNTEKGILYGYIKALKRKKKYMYNRDRYGLLIHPYCIDRRDGVKSKKGLYHMAQSKTKF